MSYYRKIKHPKNDKQGLINNVQMAVNRIEAGENREALLILVDLVDSLQGCKFQWQDENRVAIGDPEQSEEPIQRGYENTKEVTMKMIYHRNSYYI